ncbi:hypothetical protein P8452_45718 [Trifolium repens]|nr:hypothetical protein P8452_45718 [Trifolium repens]
MDSLQIQTSRLNLTRRNTPSLFAGETRSGFFRLRLSKPSACDLTCAGTTTATPPPLALVARKASTTTTGTTPRHLPPTVKRRVWDH